MYPKQSFRFLICGLVCMATILYVGTYLSVSSLINKVLSFIDDRVKPPGRLQILEPLQFANQSDVKCVNATFQTMHFPMCIYDPKDDTGVSAVVAGGGYDESDLVQKWFDLCRKHPDVSFVDLGANLGLYSLPIAHSGIHVVSVEAYEDTVRRLAKSVHLGHIENNIDVLHYALSNEQSTNFGKSAHLNRDETFMVGSAACPECLQVNVTVINKLLPFIRGKRAVFKVDVQATEIKIFQEKSAANFFDEIDVMLIQMEWILYPRNYVKSEDSRRKVDRFLEFFYKRGYDVYDPRSEKKLDADWEKWSVDVLFKKKDLPKNQLFLI